MDAANGVSAGRGDASAARYRRPGAASPAGRTTGRPTADPRTAAGPSFDGLADAVAHSVSVMTLQLGGLRRRLDDPEHREIVHGLERLGRQSVTEMRGLVGILRDAGEAGPPAPEPSLTRAGQLIGEVGAAGLPVRLEVLGERTTVPRLLDASAYRVLQEALTNVLRHCGCVPTSVTIHYRREKVDLSVVNEAPPAHSAEPTTAHPEPGGHGLVGMRERVSLFRGTLRAGPEPGGGFAVRASFPMQVPS